MSRSIRIKDHAGTRYLDISYEQGGTNGTVGSPIFSCELSEDNREIGDIYKVTISNKNTSVTPHTADVQVQAMGAGALNPYDYRYPGGTALWTGVKFDGGSTIREDIVPGVKLGFSSSASLANGWNALVYVGIFAGLMRAGNPSGVQTTWATAYNNPGATSVSAGDPGFLATVQIVNEGTSTRTECRLVFRPRIKPINISGPRGFKYVIATTSAAHEKTGTANKILPIVATFANAGIGIIDLLLDGSTVQVRDIDALSTITSTALKRDGATRYVVTETGHYCEGMESVLPTTVTNATVENLLIFNNRHVRFRLNDGTPPDESDWTSTSLDLQAPPDDPLILEPMAAALADIEWLIAALAASTQNPFPGDLIVESVDSSAAGWRD
jgi:hypothetical protein